MIRPLLALAAAAILSTILACGAAAAAGELVPALRMQLAQVDHAVAARDYPQAREALDALAAETSTARDDGRITSDQADRILAAITRVAANLSEPIPGAPATPPAPPSKPAANPGERRDIPGDSEASQNNDRQSEGEESGNGDEKGKGEESGEGGEKGKGEGKGKEADRGGGENGGGPGDGRGN